MDSKKTLGQAIDDIVAALSGLDDTARITAVRAACEHLNVSPQFPNARAVATGASAAQSSQALPAVTTAAPIVPAAAAPALAVQDIRTFKEQKAPSTAIEMACLVAYYLDSLAGPEERKKDVNSADLEKYFKQAGYRLPKRMQQVLVDAKAGGYFDSAGHGKYKLNPVGHNLVVHGLPKAKAK